MKKVIRDINFKKTNADFMQIRNYRGIIACISKFISISAAVMK